MKIKRYTALTMRAALDLVRSEQGPDAVILSSQRIEEGIEVIAAVDYDEALMSLASRQTLHTAASSDKRPAGGDPRSEGGDGGSAGGETQPASGKGVAGLRDARFPGGEAGGGLWTDAEDVQPGALTAQRESAARHIDRRVSSATADSIDSMQRELKDLRRLLENELSSLSWQDQRRREPMKAQALEDLCAFGLAPDVAHALAASLPRRSEARNPAGIPLALLVKHLPLTSDATAVRGGVLALVGPTGVGKTTTIAKLASRWSMRHGSEDLALVSTDGYRIGAREQLLTYARILGAPMHVANTAEELEQVMRRLKSKKLVLIDTAGMSQRDPRLQEQIAMLQRGAPQARALLCLPAPSETNALDEMAAVFKRARLAGCILTKLDEAAGLGAAFSVVIRHTLPLAYICDGQRVPEDLHEAGDKGLWLARTALKLKEKSPPRVNERYLARHFGRVEHHA